MKKGNSLPKPVLKIFLALTCLFLLERNGFSQAGTDCANAVPLGSNSVFLDHQHGSGREFWYSFEPDSSDAWISVINHSLPDSAYHVVKLYSGNCSSLSLIDTVVTALVVKHELTAYSLAPHQSYFIELVSYDTTGGTFDLNLRYFDPAQVQTSCPCHSPYNDPGNTCDLVCNGSFEYPVYQNASGHLDQACPWHNACCSTSDLYTATSALWGVPNNGEGVQTAHTGGNYAGFCPYMYPSCSQFWTTRQDYKEYLIVPLKEPLAAGKCYTFSMYLSCSEQSRFASGDFGVYFSATPLPAQSNNGEYIPLNPQLYFPSIITNTSGWTNLVGTYTATGGEYQLIIGNFESNVSTPNAQTGFVDFNNISNYPAYSYYYIDDVTLVPCCTAFSVSGPFNSVCTNDTISLTGLSPCQNNSMTWSPANLIIGPNGSSVLAQATPPTTTFYCTMTLTDYGCTKTDSVIVYATQSPYANAGSDTTLCGSRPVVLNGTGTNTSYGWSTLAGQTLCSPCTTVTVTPAVTTSYVYHVYNAHGGCTGYDTMTVFVYPDPHLHIVAPPNAVICDTALHFSLTGLPANYTSVHWTSNAQSAQGSHTPDFSAAWTTNTDAIDGYVTVTVTDADGCTWHDSLVIPHCCCKNEFNVPTGLVATDDNVDSLIAHYPGYITINASGVAVLNSASLCINGVFDVNRDLDLQNVKVAMGPNARINVLQGHTLTLEATGNSFPQQTLIHACYTMWDGIYVYGPDPNTLLDIKDGTVIEDAKNAIVSVAGGNFHIQGGSGSGPVKLNKNYIGIWIKPFSGTHPGYIRKTIIACDNQFQPGGSSGYSSSSNNLIYPYNNNIGYAGILIDSCQSFTVGDTAQANYHNVFERMHFGVYARKSNVRVWNNDFRYITSSPVQHKTAPADGVAVYSSGFKNQNYSLIVGVPGTTKAANKIKWCSYGVMATTNVSLSCQYNHLDSCTAIGIYALNNNNSPVLINQDTLKDCTGTNISCLDNANSTVKITRNVINENVTSSNTGNYGYTGIYVANSVQHHSSVLIQDNTIRKMRNGIWVSRIVHPLILDNSSITIVATQAFTLASPATGIHIEGCASALVRNNHVRYLGTASAANYDKLFGIYIENCFNDTITQDSLINMGSGIFLKGADNPSLLACNKMKNCYYGMNFGYTNSLNNPVPLNDQIHYGTAQTATPTGNHWVGCTTDMRGAIQAPPLGINWWTNAANAPVTINLSGASLTNNNAPIVLTNSDQCTNLLLPPPVKPITMRSYLLHDICVAPRSYDTLGDQYTYNDDFFAYRALRDSSSWLNLGTSDDTAYQGFYDTTSTSNYTNIAYLADAQDQIAAGNYSQAQADLDYVKYGNNIPENNWKTVMLVYLHSWAIDSMNLTDAQADSLMPIANQGGITGGVAVFDARNMLGLEVHDSSNARIISPIASGDTAQGISIGHAYPNPTTGQVSINANLKEGQTATMNLYDLTGRQITTWKLSGGQSVYTFDASFLPGGTYIYRVESEGQIIEADRLVIIRE
ncbi:MAG TPA: T9SS type A sorting domain-containing protein [Bacteroidia bacterium]|nr:T9SS type A sorting domain-containing protein [Bacteroidia bacterium]